MEETKTGWLVCITDTSEGLIPNALHIERDDSMMVYADDYEAAKAYEQQGGKIIHDMGERVEDWTYVDTPENRALISAFLQQNPAWSYTPDKQAPVMTAAQSM